MPGQSNVALGLEVLVAASATWVLVMSVQYRNAHHPVEANEHRGSRFVLTQIAILPFVVGGATIVAEAGGGLHWSAGMVATFVVAAATAWVLLVEIMRSPDTTRGRAVTWTLPRSAANQPTRSFRNRTLGATVVSCAPRAGNTR